jgi:hypothetical protein
MPKFQTVIKSARFVYSPYTATEMQGFAQVLADSIRARIQSGQNIYDQAAAPLKPGLPSRRGYPDYKAARGLQPIRDWTWSGHTLRCLKVLTANENRAAIGFLDEALPGRRQTASQIAAFNNLFKRFLGTPVRPPQERALVRACAKRLRRLEGQFGPEDGKPRSLLVVCNAGWGLALDRDTCIQILGECGFLPSHGFSVVSLCDVPEGLSSPLRLLANTIGITG